MELWVIHGPLLDRLGTREPAVYGTTPLTVLNQRLIETAAQHGATLRAHYAADEAQCLSVLDRAAATADAVILNPAALTHTSVAVRDAVVAYARPVIEVHLSNIAAREPFRAHSLIAPVATGTIFGLGTAGYEAAVIAAIQLVEQQRATAD